MRHFATLLLALMLPACHDQARGGATGARDAIRAVGSSTLYPFTTLVAERFVESDPRAKPPVIESTGTGAGFRLFCAGLGARHPDLADASRRMGAGEYRLCRRNGVGPVIEVPVGIDGVVLAEPLDGPGFRLTRAQLYRALAAEPGGRPNAARRWSDVDPTLPDLPIAVYGPPATSGTRDALVELVMVPGCDAADPGARRLAPAPRAARCGRIREDGAFIDSGENDNLIVQKLGANPHALGVFGYSYLEENADAVRGVPVEGVAPSYRSIADGRYPGARPLYLYAKRNHLDAVPGLRRFLRLYAASWAPGGPLARRGLIASPRAARAAAAEIVRTERPLDPRSLG